MPELILVRHAKTPWNVFGNSGRICGAGSDPDLNEEGREQAKLLALYIRDLYGRAGSVVCSSRTRSISTSSYIDRATDVVVDRRVEEINFGDWEGQQKGDLEGTERWISFETDPLTVAPPRGESAYDVWRRFREFLAGSSALPAPCVVVTHKYPIRLAISSIVDLGLSSFRSRDIRLASVSVIDWDSQRVHSISSRSHLE
jgi:broad specificity phosphatase PhoE